MNRSPLAILLAVFCAVTMRTRAQELERRVTCGEKAVPLSLHLREGGPFVDATVNGQPARFMVWPELEFSQISKTSAERLGLKPLTGYDSVVLTPSLTLGGAEIRNEPWQVEDYSQDGRRLDGIIGHSTLREFTVRLNYPGDELMLMNPDNSPPVTPGEGVMEMILTEQDISLTGTKVSARRGGFTARATATGGVLLPLKFNASRAGNPTLPEPLVKEKLPGLSSKPGTVIQPHLRLGHEGIGGMEFQVTEKGLQGVPDDAGVLTVEVLKYFTVTLDYAHRRVRMSLKTRPLYTVTGAQFTIQPDEKGEWRVTNVKEKSPAQLAGVEKGDLLLSLAGTPCTTLSPGELDKLQWSKRQVVFARGGDKDRREITVTWTEADEGPKDPLLLGFLREWTFPEGSDSVGIPVSLSGSSPLVEVKVNGHALRCVLDTGASTSVLSLEAAERAGLKKGQRRDGLSISNEQVTAFQTIAETVEIGGLIIRREPWGVTAFPEVLTREAGIDGLIGLGTLRDFVVRMDWKAKKVTLWKRGKEPAVEGGFTVPVKLEEWPMPPPAVPAPQRFRPVACRMMLNLCGQTFPCTMDTGSSGGLRFPETLMREKLPAVAATAGPLLENGSGLSGVVMVRMIHIPEFTLGNETLKDLPAGVGPFAEGIVGMRILRHFTITLDADGGRLHLLPYGTLSEFTSGSTLGMAPVVREGRMVVGTVIPGGPAEAAGIKAGDVIVSLDGEDVMEKKEKGKEEKDEKEQKTPPPGTPVKVKVNRQGVEMEFTVTTRKL